MYLNLYFDFEANKVLTFNGHQGVVSSLAVLQNGDLVSGSFDNTIKVWNTNKGIAKNSLKESAFVRELFVLENGDLLSLSQNVAFDNFYNIFNTTNWSVKKSKNLEYDSYYPTLLPNNEIAYLYIRTVTVTEPEDNTSFFPTIRIFNIKDETIVREFEVEGNCEFSKISAFSNGDLVFGCYRDILIYSQNGKFIRKLKGHSSYIMSFTFLKTGELVSSSFDKTIKIWDLKDWTARTLTGHSNSVNLLAVLQNGYLASSSLDLTIKIWNPYDMKLIKTFTGHAGNIHDLIVLPNGDLASASSDKTIKIWIL